MRSQALPTEQCSNRAIKLTPTRNHWLFLLLGALIGALATAAYWTHRWKAEEIRLNAAHAELNLSLLERLPQGGNSVRDSLRREAQTYLGILGARDDLSFHQCVTRRRLLDRADKLAGLTSGNDDLARHAETMLSRHRAGGFVCEKR